MKTLSVVMSEQCNLNCTYCNVDKQSKKRIDVGLFLEQFKTLRATYPDELIKIDLFGGEPLIQYDMVQHIVESTKADGNVKYFMPTNGLLLTEDKLDYLQANGVEISLSFDGLWQDTNRAQFTNRSSLKKYLDKLPIFNKITNFQIHTMIQKGNYNLLENHLYISNVMGANPDLTLVRDIGTWDQESVEKLNKGITELFDWYVDNVNSAEMPNFIRSYLKHVILYKSKGHEVHTCGAGVSYFAFSEDHLVPCNRFKDEPEVVAKIPVFTRMNACTTCEVRFYCKKGCLYEQIKNDGPIVELCHVYKHIYKEVFKMLASLKDNEIFVGIVKKEIRNEL